jgi:hypothetical protein
MKSEFRNRPELDVKLALSIGAVMALIIFWLTAYKSITWWMGCSYITAAIHLGNTFPPGSLFLTIIGWLISLLPLGISKAYQLNLAGGVIGALTCLVVAIVSYRLIRRQYPEVFSNKKIHRIVISLYIGIFGMTLAMGETMWRYSVQFTPYVLTATFTGLIIWAMLRWWETSNRSDNLRLIFVILLLIGLDFSVHRTNILLLPGVIVWVALRRPKLFLRFKAWLTGAAGLILGLIFHLFTIPIAARNPVINAGDPSNWARFYDYISLKQYGGGWLVNLFPRKGNFLNVQLTDYWQYFTNNFLNTDGTLGLIGILPAVLFLLGLVVLFIKNIKFAAGMLTLFVLFSLGAVFYFNLPENFYWPMDRHYLPSFLIFAVIAAFGAGSFLVHIFNFNRRYHHIPTVLALIVLILIPANQITRNYNSQNASDRHFAYDYAQNILLNVQPDAIVYIMGDNYWPPFYLNTAEKIRPDVTVVSTSLTNTPWYIRQLIEREPDFPLPQTEEELNSRDIPSWKDSTVIFPVDSSVEIYRWPDSLAMPDSIAINVTPTLADQFLMRQDWLLLKIMQENQWRRPIYFTNPPAWLKSYCRPEGLVHCLLPYDSALFEGSVLQENLMDNYIYRGYADPSIVVNKFSRSTGQELFEAFLNLARIKMIAGHPDQACTIVDLAKKRLPPERINFSPEILKAVDEMCGKQN